MHAARLIPGFLVLLLAAGGCKPRPTPGSVESAPPAGPRAARVGVLYVEESAESAATDRALYADQVEKLAALLRARGIAAETLLVPADDEEPAVPTPIDLAILVDTPRLRDAEERMLTSFVEDGGVLLAIGPPPAPALMGVTPTGPDPVPRAGATRIADTTLAWAAETNWGPLASERWPVARTEAGLVIEEGDAPLLAVRTAGGGRAYHWAVLPTGRKFNGWDAAPGAVALVEGLARSLVARGRPPAGQPLAVTAAAAYSSETGWPSRVVARIRGGDSNAALKGTFVARAEGGDLLHRGAFEEGGARWRSRFLVADPGVLPGEGHRIEVEIPPAAPVSVEPVARVTEFRRALDEAVAAWLDRVAWPEPDKAGADLARLVEDRGLLIWALARAAQAYSAPERHRQRYAMERAAYWLRAAGPALFSGPAAPDAVLAAYAAGLARAVGPIRDGASRHLAQEIQMLAEQAYAQLSARPAADTAGTGGRLWAAAELYRATHVQDYRAAAESLARQVFGRQVPRGRFSEGDVFGVFFQDEDRLTLAPEPARAGYEAGLILGLIHLEQLVEPGSPKVDLGVILDRFSGGFLLASAALNPYRVCAVGLEPAEPPRPRPDGRGMATPERTRPLYFSRGAPPAGRGDEAVRLAHAVAALERFQVTREPALLRIAQDQIHWLAGLNPAGRPLVAGGRLAGGWIGRGPDATPVWRGDADAAGAGFPEMPWLLVLTALLDEAQP